MRSLDGVSTIALLINDASVEVQQQALLVLGNLCSDALDPNSILTKRLLLQGGADRDVTLTLYSNDVSVLLYACGCLQNLCVDDEWAKALVANEVEKRLAELLVHQDYRVVNYAAGAIKNLMQRVGRSEELQQLPPEQLAAIQKRDRDMLLQGIRYRRAIKKLVQFARNIPPERRLARIMAANNPPPKQAAALPNAAPPVDVTDPAAEATAAADEAAAAAEAAARVERDAKAEAAAKAATEEAAATKVHRWRARRRRGA